MKRFLVFLCLICALSGLSWAGNFGSSIEGKDANVSFVHTSAIDSAHFVFAYPDTANWYDSVFAYPVAWGAGKILNGAGLELDSIGVHIIKVRYYSGGTVAGYTAGVWLHAGGSGSDTTAIKAMHDNRETAVVGDEMALTTTTKQSIANLNYDTLFIHKTDFHSSGDTNTNPFQAGTDNVILSNNVENIANRNYDTMYVHRTDFQSSGDTNTNPFDPTSDVVARVTFVDSTDTVIKASAASIDYGEIADTVWTHAVRTLTSGTGTGSNQVIIRTKSSLDSAVIPKASVAVWNADQSALMGLLSTDTDSGKATFALDNGTYNLRIQKYKFQWTVPITIGVSGNKDTTVYATEFTPSPPPSSDLCTVYGYIDSVGLVGHRAQISCTIHGQELRIGTKMLAYYSYTKTVFTNPGGYWEMFLPPNGIITPTETQYVFEIKSPYQPILKKWVTVPELANWEFTF